MWVYNFLNMFAPLKKDKIKDWPFIYFGLYIRAIAITLFISIEGLAGVI